MLVVLNYKDGEYCISLDEANNTIKDIENPDNNIDYKDSILESRGESPGARTQHHLIKSQVLYQMS